MASAQTPQSNTTPTGVASLPQNRIVTLSRTLLKDKRVRGILQLALSLALLAWLANRVGFDAIGSTLADISWAWYLPAFVVFLGNVLLRAYRWHILVRALQQEVSYNRLLYLYFLGFFFNNFIPSGFGGDVVKVLALKQKQSRGAAALSSVLMDRLTGLIGSALIGLIVLAWNGVQAWLSGGTTPLNLPAPLVMITALVSFGIPAGFMLIRSVDLLELIGRYLPFTRRVTTHAGLQKLVRTIRGYPLDALLQALSVSLPFTVGLVAIQYGIARALAVEVPFHLFFLFVPIISIINTLPISFNGLGMREGVYQFLFVPVGVSSAAAIAMSLAFYFLRVAAGLIGGLLYAVKSVRKLA